MKFKLILVLITICFMLSILTTYVFPIFMSELLNGLLFVVGIICGLVALRLSKYEPANDRGKKRNEKVKNK